MNIGIRTNRLLEITHIVALPINIIVLFRNPPTEKPIS